ncbi:MAG TPA: hypothetical protein VFH61_06575 [Thermoleophilia bacterium]|nr:hypothetical protein [Thermoleophilia bacterium]
MADQLECTGIAALLGPDSIFPARSLVCESAEEVLDEGRLRPALPSAMP